MHPSLGLVPLLPAAPKAECTHEGVTASSSSSVTSSIAASSSTSATSSIAAGSSGLSSSSHQVRRLVLLLLWCRQVDCQRLMLLLLLGDSHLLPRCHWCHRCCCCFILLQSLLLLPLLLPVPLPPLAQHPHPVPISHSPRATPAPGQVMVNVNRSRVSICCSAATTLPCLGLFLKGPCPQGSSANGAGAVTNHPLVNATLVEFMVAWQLPH
jgi:hypothetical protein